MVVKPRDYAGCIDCTMEGKIDMNKKISDIKVRDGWAMRAENHTDRVYLSKKMLRLTYLLFAIHLTLLHRS